MTPLTDEQIDQKMMERFGTTEPTDEQIDSFEDEVLVRYQDHILEEILDDELQLDPAGIARWFAEHTMGLVYLQSYVRELEATVDTLLKVLKGGEK